jgi:hypothetical protein
MLSQMCSNSCQIRVRSLLLNLCLAYLTSEPADAPFCILCLGSSKQSGTGSQAQGERSNVSAPVSVLPVEKTHSDFKKRHHARPHSQSFMSRSTLPKGPVGGGLRLTASLPVLH